MSVYLITSTADPFVVKIGFSGKDPGQRLKQLQTACPFDLELAAVLPGNEALERKLHRTFAPLRLRGEWFRGDHKLRDFVFYLSAYAHPISALELQNAVQDCIVSDAKFYPDSVPNEVYAASADASLWKSAA